MTVETLTAEERAWLEADPDFQKWDVRRKVLRIIDAQAADRAELERDYESMMAERNAVQGALERSEVLATEWKQTAEGYRLELQVLRTENEKLIAGPPRG